jgi:hypothetical protein
MRHVILDTNDYGELLSVRFPAGKRYAEVWRTQAAWTPRAGEVTVERAHRASALKVANYVIDHDVEGELEAIPADMLNELFDRKWYR